MDEGKNNSLMVNIERESFRASGGGMEVGPCTNLGTSAAMVLGPRASTFHISATIYDLDLVGRINLLYIYLVEIIKLKFSGFAAGVLKLLASEHPVSNKASSYY